MRPFRCALLALLAAGCVVDRTGQSATAAWHREMAIQSTRTQSLQQAMDDALVRVQQLEEVTRARGQEEIYRMETVDQLRNEVARLRGEVEVLQHESAQAGDRSSRFLEDAEFRFGYVDTRLAALEAALGLKPPATVAAATPANPAAAPADPALVPADPAAAATPDPATAPAPEAEPPADATPEALFALGQTHLDAERWKAARVVFQRFAERYPSDPRIAEALYRLADTWAKDGQHQQAILAYQTVVDGYADTPWAPWAMLRQGQAFAALGQKDNATLFYEDVIRLYPKSKAAKEARALKK